MLLFVNCHLNWILLFCVNIMHKQFRQKRWCNKMCCIWSVGWKKTTTVWHVSAEQVVPVKQSDCSFRFHSSKSKHRHGQSRNAGVHLSSQPPANLPPPLGLYMFIWQCHSPSEGARNSAVAFESGSTASQEREFLRNFPDFYNWW